MRELASRLAVKKDGMLADNAKQALRARARSRLGNENDVPAASRSRNSRQSLAS